MGTTKRVATTGFLATLLALLALALFFWANFTTVSISGESMLPTYGPGSRLLASKAYWLIGPVGRKDVVVIRDPEKKGQYLIKRVLALAGEVVDFRNAPTNWSLAQGEYVVPEGHIYVVGDNYAASEDSRRFGPVPTETVLGKVVHLAGSNLLWLGTAGALVVAGASGLVYLARHMRTH